MAVLALAVATVHAQVPQSIVPMPAQPRQKPLEQKPLEQKVPAMAPDSMPKPPLSPGKAFFASLLLPGYAQSRLNRPTASVLYAAFEVLSLGMARKAAQDLREAKSFSGDSVVTGYTIDPTSGLPVPSTYATSRYTQQRIDARRTHYEDWIAALIFNHLISAADAYVAAQLWDFNANLSIKNGQRTATISAHRSF